MADDEELAEQWADAPESPSTGPRLSEYTPEVAGLDKIYDRLGELIAITVQAHSGKKAPRIRPAKRPETALEKVRKRLAEQRVTSIIDEVMEAQQRWAETHQN